MAQTLVSDTQESPVAAPGRPRADELKLTPSSPATPRLPELRKKPGVCYALGQDGVELPIVDVTCPDFAIAMTEEELAQFVARFIAEERRSQRIPTMLRAFLYRVFLRRSALARGVVSARVAGRFLSGMSTYLLKLGPENLGRSYTTPIDRRVAASLPAFALRLRLQDMAQLLASGVEPQLARDPNAALVLVNIGGGASLDSLNALILLHKRAPTLISKRRIVVRVLDVDDQGPRFGAQALAALSERHAPLAGLDINFEHAPYDWKDSSRLADLIHAPLGTVVATSSEGALFEYGSDAEVVANLRAIAAHTPEASPIVGSVTRSDGAAPYMTSFLQLPIRPRTLAAFTSLAEQAGFRVSQNIDRPFSHNVRLVRG